ncbi:unnamed protein product [Lampetra planeri]
MEVDTSELSSLPTTGASSTVGGGDPERPRLMGGGGTSRSRDASPGRGGPVSIATRRAAPSETPEMSDSDAEREEDGDEDVVGEEEDLVSEEGKEGEQGDEEEHKDEDVEPAEVVPDNRLALSDMQECISLLCKTGDGLALAYVRLLATARSLTNISILSGYPHLRYIDVSSNRIADLSPLSNLSYLVSLKADGNVVETTEHPAPLGHLQVLSLAHNRVASAGTGLQHAQLQTLNLTGNALVRVEGLGRACRLVWLHTLELRGNKLSSTAGLEQLTSLQQLYMAANQITWLEGLSSLHKLTTLHLRDNRVSSLGGFSSSMAALQYLNLRGNKVEDVKEVLNLRCLPLLRVLVLSENRCSDGFGNGEGEEEAAAEEEDDEAGGMYRAFVLATLPRLQRLDKQLITAEERASAAQEGVDA